MSGREDRESHELDNGSRGIAPGHSRGCARWRFPYLGGGRVSAEGHAEMVDAGKAKAGITDKPMSAATMAAEYSQLGRLDETIRALTEWEAAIRADERDRAKISVDNAHTEREVAEIIDDAVRDAT